MRRVLEDNLNSGILQASAPIPTLHPSSCVALGKGLSLPGPLFPFLLNGDNHLVAQS